MANSITNYITILNELNAAKAVLEFYNEKRENLQIKLLGIKGISFDNDFKGNRTTNSDRVIAYLDLYENKPCENGISLKTNIEIKEDEVKKLEQTKAEIEQILLKLTGYDEMLFTEVVVKGKRITQAVSTISRKKYIAETTLWKYYVPKVKENLKMIKRY